LVENPPAAAPPPGAARSIEDAVRSADIVCATTHADEPVVRRQWLRPGTHVNSVGYNTAGPGEVDAETVSAALVAVELRAAALAELPAGAVELRALSSAEVSPAERYVEIGELATGIRPGRTDGHQITLYKSVGVAAQDAAAAALVLEVACSTGAGTDVRL
jgi:alanine dehydrogenase